jgi:predicted dehydrogenase
MRKVRWGVLSTARIGTEKVIPAMQRGRFSEVTAIASRDSEAARSAAARLAIPRWYDSYDGLLADPTVEAVYIPLPNHLHVPWSLRALEAGKHVLCEKPIALNVREAERLRDAAGRNRELKVMEAFMYRHHPQWDSVLDLVRGGEIGELRTIHSCFSYHNVAPLDIRNIRDLGGGGLLDIGCYCISVARTVFGGEPLRVTGSMDLDPEFATDRLTSAILQFTSGTATFTCSTQLAPHQRVAIFGTTGRLEVEMPFTPGPNQRCHIWHYDRSSLNEIVVGPVDQYTIQGDRFSRAILNDDEVPVPLSDAVANMRVIDAVVESVRANCWVDVDGVN